MLTQDIRVPKLLRTGTHRSVMLEETITRVHRLMPAMGITRVANVTFLDNIGIPVVMVCRPNSRSLAVSQGKGLTLLAAKVSGLMESVESYHAEHITSPVKYASYEELCYTHRVIDVSELPQIKNTQYHGERRLLWIQGFDLINHESIWVPYELVHMDYTLPLPPGSGCFPLSSNGLASGNHVLEAVSHAICEAVERDSTVLWMLKQELARQETKIRLDTIHDEAACALLDQLDRSGVNVMIWDTTTDIGIPSFLCTLTQRSQDPWHLARAATGMGCHPTRIIALLRAITEAAQSRLTYISGSRDDMFREKYDESVDPTMLEAFDAEMSVPAQRRFELVPNQEAETLNEDVDWEVHRLCSVGVTRIVVVDLTKCEFGIPVVRVLISGIEGTDEATGYTPGLRALDLIQRQQ